MAPDPTADPAAPPARPRRGSRRALLRFSLAALMGVGVAVAQHLVPRLRVPIALAPTAAPTVPLPMPSAAPTHVPTEVPTPAVQRRLVAHAAPPTRTPAPARPTPQASPLPAAADVPALASPAIITQAAWGAAPPAGAFLPQTPRLITLHHEGVYFDGSIPAAQYLRQVQRWCITNRGWPDIPYHFLIDLDGLIYAGRPLETRGDTNTAYDLQDHALVAVIGKYDAGEQVPTQIQIDAVITLMAWIASSYAIPVDQIHGHRDYIPVNKRGEHIDPRTGEKITCPGDNLYRYLADGTIPQGVAQVLRPKTAQRPSRLAMG